MTVIEIAEKINEYGGRLYLVGGAVRDTLLGLIPKDYDYCVTGFEKEDFMKMFPEAQLQGKSFPVFIIDGNEYALARIEKKTSSGHSGFEILTDKTITIEEDLKRRDITINSIAIDVLTRKVIDPFGGMKDMKNKIIRATSEAFLEDPLRVYRTARFAAQLSGVSMKSNEVSDIFGKDCYTVDVHTLALMNKCKEELSSLSSERVFAELEKALKTRKPSMFFNVLRAADVLEVHFKEVYDLIGIEQPIKYHPEGDAYNHTMDVIDRIAMCTNDACTVFSGLVHDFGKALTPRDEWPHHINHEENGCMPLKNICKRLKMPNKWYKVGLTACKEHMRAGIFDKMTTKKKVDFITRVHASRMSLYDMEILANADKNSKEKVEFAEIGEEMIGCVNAKNYPKDMDFNILKDEVRRRRIKWLKEKYFPKEGGYNEL